jgi:hypothetical protein
MVGVVINPHAFSVGPIGGKLSIAVITVVLREAMSQPGSSRSFSLRVASFDQGTHCGAKTSVDSLGDQEGAISATPLWPVSAQATTHQNALLWHCPTNQLPGAMQIGLPVHHYI